MNEEDTIVQMLTEFYITYNKIWAEIRDSDAFSKQLDSAWQKYCTQKFRKELKKEFETHGVDHDIFTADYGMDNESIKTLSISKDNKKEVILNFE